MAIAYLDSSALVKLMVREDETSALEADLAARDGVLASWLAVVECRRVVLRAGKRRLLQVADEVSEAVYLLDLTAPILEHASTLAPGSMRTLDALHVATALSVHDPALDVITYDDRMADAARAHKLSVVQPGR